MTDVKSKDEDVTRFTCIINKEGRVKVAIEGPHVAKKTFNRIGLAMNKAYKFHIRTYRKQVKRDMNKAQLDELVAEPTSLEVESNGRVLDKPVEDLTFKDAIIELEAAPMQQIVGEEALDVKETGVEVTPITKPIAKVVESKKLSLNEVIAAKRAKKLLETK